MKHALWPEAIILFLYMFLFLHLLTEKQDAFCLPKLLRLRMHFWGVAEANAVFYFEETVQNKKN